MARNVVPNRAARMKIIQALRPLPAVLDAHSNALRSAWEFIEIVANADEAERRRMLKPWRLSNINKGGRPRRSQSDNAALLQAVEEERAEGGHTADAKAIKAALRAHYAAQGKSTAGLENSVQLKQKLKTVSNRLAAARRSAGISRKPRRNVSGKK